MFEIKDLHVKVEDTPILKGFSLKILPGEIHALMGPNGAGKSTLAKVIAGHPSYEVTAGDILLDGESILEMEPEERAALGLFMSFQYPIEVPGISNREFLKAAYKAIKKTDLPEDDLLEKTTAMGIDLSFLDRDLNTGFSGGEKKRNEILQLLILDPRLSVLDETDSGLDIDAMKIVAEGVNTYMNPEKGLLLITHYQRLLDYIKPQFVHVVIDGKIATSGGPEVALELEAKGYQC
ncbi:MAG: Vegetative protein 296 [Chlamydiia bacterium]|nr:Vegetative protein 296 [Chlamydiia bacterium]MCH9616217.1 Vegetative protein 296 [Chlamydiia bacterium]MCH9629797.1 Vegetative protein 296 [Chlamydiia bacterium]